MALENYLPSSRRIPNSIGLSLSGGGFRATLFHLGALRRLQELGMVPRLTTISSVSGGSILNGFLASRLSQPLSSGIADFGKDVSAPIRQFCSLDIRRWLVPEAVIPGVQNSAGLAKQYDEHLTAKMLLKDIPAAPVHTFCSTDLDNGVNWMFKKLQCGDYRVGFVDTPADWSVATAVAASSCFPPVFKPLQLNIGRDISLSDGGVYDNLGLEPIWKDHEIVLSSDGGALFPIGGDTGFLWEVSRFISIPENQALALRKRWLISNFTAGQLKGAYWGVGSSRASYGLDGGYSDELAKNYIAAIRTDLDSFSDAEASILENHGYGVADAALQTHARGLLPDPVPALQIPYPEWVGSDDKIKEALKDSAKRKLLGRS
jgi:NTE family protein